MSENTDNRRWTVTVVVECECVIEVEAPDKEEALDRARGRYVREDPYAIFSGVLMLYVVLRYLEDGQRKFLYLLAAALLLHFIDKETAFIYSAELLIFLAVYFVARVTRRVWDDVKAYRSFLLLLAIGILLLAVGMGIGLSNQQAATLGATEGAAL